VTELAGDIRFSEMKVDARIMGTASFRLLGFTLVAAIVYNLFGSLRWRQGVLLVANAYFLYTFMGNAQSILPFLAFVTLGYVGVRAMQGQAKKWTYVATLVLVTGSFVWLKKYAFLPSGTFLQFDYVTVGLSYVLFRVLHLMIDAHAAGLPVKIGPVSYWNYTLSFLTLVSGPIQRYEDFQKTGNAPLLPRPTVIAIGEGLHRVVLGSFKVAVLSLLFARLQKHMLGALSAGQGPLHTAVTAAAIAVSYTFCLYFNFSGYIDVVIGLGRFFGFRLPENFDRPLSADNFMTFWNRWHITLSNWFKSYVFNPLLLATMRRTSSVDLQPLLAVPAIFFTFFLVGVWHGRTSEFLFFGLLNGFGVAANLLFQIILQKEMGRKRYNALASNGTYVALCRGLTFTWFTFTLLWFWSNWGQLRGISLLLGTRGSFLVFLTIFLAATISLGVFNTIRDRVLALRWKNASVVLSPYTLTVFDTILAIGCFAVLVVLQHAAPPIVYRAF
jgi:D-alanyl-lipoteichoic acid acyltransferase DltB (MBOAT superfamily)